MHFERRGQRRQTPCADPEPYGRVGQWHPSPDTALKNAFE